MPRWLRPVVKSESASREPALGGSHRFEGDSFAVSRDVVPVEALFGAEGKADLALELRSE
jgi:hypothetical protein